MQSDSKKHIIQAGAILGTDSLSFFNLANPFMLTLRSAQFLLHAYIAYNSCVETAENQGNEEYCDFFKKRFIITLHMVLGSMVLGSIIMLSITIEKDEIKDCHTHENEYKSLCSEIDLIARIHFGMIAAAGAVGLIQGIKQNMLGHAPDEVASPASPAPPRLAVTP